jgi:hypothetical protein
LRVYQPLERFTDRGARNAEAAGERALVKAFSFAKLTRQHHVFEGRGDAVRLSAVQSRISPWRWLQMQLYSFPS